jgi:hypothetical protein
LSNVILPDVAQAPSRRSSAAAVIPTVDEGAPPERPGADDGRYSIRVASRLTSIELDTLRMWERRYGFPRPERTGGGSRIYSESDIETLRLIRRSLELGYRPGEVVGKTRDELARLVLATSQAPVLASSPAPTLGSLLAALARDDIPTLHAELRQATLVLGAKRFITDVAHPLCVRVGELWAEGKLEVRHEHMLSERLSSHLGAMMCAHEDRAGAPRVLLATLPDERHGLGLEMVQVYLATNHVSTLLLGVDTPPEQIVKAALIHAVDAVGILVSPASDLVATTKDLRWMAAELPRRVSVWIGGRGGAGLALSDDAFRVVATWADVDAAIASLPRRAS